MTYRAVEVLSSAALVVAEDTRHSRTLLDRYAIRTATSAYHEHNEARESPRLVARMLAGESVALVTDAGTPLVSDPGERLVRAAIEAGIQVVPVPGASAVLAALVTCGFETGRFTFYGFLERKGRERTSAIAEIARSPVVAVLYESPNRTGATLRDLAEAGAGDRRAVVARELTKKFEEVMRGTITELADRCAGELKGEVVIVVDRAIVEAPGEEAVRARAAELRAEGAGARDVVERLMSELGVARNLAYRIVHGD